jgi:hypothetical protein
MADLFSRTEVNFGGAMTSQFGLVTPNNGLSGVLMQNVNMSYQQQVTRLYELGNSGALTNVYYVGGRAQGTLTTAHVVGPGVAMATFYSNFSDVCQAGQNSLNLNLTPNLCNSNAAAAISGFAVGGGGPSAAYTAKYCVLTMVGVSAQASEFVINSQSQMMFSGLSYTGS